MDVKRYASLAVARRMTSLRSRNAAIRGEFSQYAVIRPTAGGMYYAGPVNELFRQCGNARPIVAFSAGYFCKCDD